MYIIYNGQLGTPSHPSSLGGKGWAFVYFSTNLQMRKYHKHLHTRPGPGVPVIPVLLWMSRPSEKYPRISHVWTPISCSQPFCLSPPDLAGLQKRRPVACFTIISNASIDILQNGFPEICCVTVSKQDIKQNTLKPKHLHTKLPTHLYKSHIHPQSWGAAAKPPPTPFEDSYLVCISAWMTVCSCFAFSSCLHDVLLRDCDTTHFGPAILQNVNGGIVNDCKTLNKSSDLATRQRLVKMMSPLDAVNDYLIHDLV